MLSQTIRRQFLRYFEQKNHIIIPSSSVVPHDDPSLLFINAGMNQFKDVFLGKSTRDYTRATSSQKCIRVGGKHNDLENVGHTRRHLTLFEMLGNFSFGDYFKKEAIDFAWQVSTEVFGFDPHRIWPTVFREDDEAFELWTKYVSPDRITRFDEKDNFWAMGDTGPCGPCSELLYDRGDKYGTARRPSEDPSGERFLEFWNLVFMQFNRDNFGAQTPLAKQSIDTGAGLERVVSLKMDVDNVFATDILRSLIAEIENISGIPYELGTPLAPAFHVIADHIRTLAFAIADGAQPSNVDRGYVLRKVLRRAVRYGRSLRLNEPFLARVLPRLIDTMGADYPEIKTAQSRIEELLTIEEEGFLKTLRRGGNLLQQVMASAEKTSQISGDDAFKLKDTYGFPLEEIELIAKDANLTIDTPRYQQLEEEARERSRKAHKGDDQQAKENIYSAFLEEHGASQFVGYKQTECKSLVKGIVRDGVFVNTLEPGEKGIILLDKTPFYAEMGGQVGDTGALFAQKSSFQVLDTTAPYTGIIAHIGVVAQNPISVGDVVEAAINKERRNKICCNHSATHLIHAALCQVLGEHVKQAGSLVDPHRIRFDFSHHKALTSQEIEQIENHVNQMIRSNHPIHWYEKAYIEVQKNSDIKQFFGDKYGTHVRVVDIGGCKELCGGTHTSNTSLIGQIKIVKEGSVAAGVRRIEAISGEDCELLWKEERQRMQQVADLLKCTPAQVSERLQQWMDEHKKMQSEIKAMKQEQQKMLEKDLLQQAPSYENIQAIIAKVNLTAAELRPFAQNLVHKLQNGIVILAIQEGEKCFFLAQVNPALVKKGWNAATLLKGIHVLIDGSGGGKPEQAQAGGKNIQQIDRALEDIKLEIVNLSKVYSV